MGLFDFVSDLGEKIFGSDPTPEEMQAQLGARLDELGLEITDRQLAFEDGTVSIGGEVVSQEIREKSILAVGNVEGVSQVNDQLRLAVVEGPPEPEAQFYEVKKGDSLSKIAGAFYDDVMKYPVIFEANKPMLKDPDLIYPGQVLRIPPLS